MIASLETHGLYRAQAVNKLPWCDGRCDLTVDCCLAECTDVVPITHQGLALGPHLLGRPSTLPPLAGFVSLFIGYPSGHSCADHTLVIVHAYVTTGTGLMPTASPVMLQSRSTSPCTTMSSDNSEAAGLFSCCHHMPLCCAFKPGSPMSHIWLPT